MNPKVWLAQTVRLAAILVLLFSTPVWGADVTELEGVGLSENEMAEIRGGFLLGNGDFMALTLDYMKLQFLSQADLRNPDSGSWINALSQQVRITDKGIEFGSSIFQGGTAPTGAPGEMSSLLQNNQVAVSGSLSGFTGVGSGNFISGNYNTASIVNIFNIQMDIIKASDLSTVRPELASFLIH